MITIEAKPLTYDVEIPGYGVFTLSRLGAGKEAEMSYRLRVADEKQKEVSRRYKGVIEQEKKLLDEKNDEELKKLRASKEYLEAKEAQAETSAALRDAVLYQREAVAGLWNSQNQKALERLKNDFSSEQLNELYLQVMQQVAQGRGEKQ